MDLLITMMPSAPVFFTPHVETGGQNCSHGPAVEYSQSDQVSPDACRRHLQTTVSLRFLRCLFESVTPFLLSPQSKRSRSSTQKTWQIYSRVRATGMGLFPKGSGCRLESQEPILWKNRDGRGVSGPLNLTPSPDTAIARTGQVAELTTVIVSSAVPIWMAGV